jgi:hypothetical protein
VRTFPNGAIPFEVFPSPTAAPRHRGRCLLDVTVRHAPRVDLQLNSRLLGLSQGVQPARPSLADRSQLDPGLLARRLIRSLLSDRRSLGRSLLSYFDAAPLIRRSNLCPELANLLFLEREPA